MKKSDLGNHKPKKGWSTQCGPKSYSFIQEAVPFFISDTINRCVIVYKRILYSGMLVHIELKKLNAFYFSFLVNCKGLFWRKRVWFYGATGVVLWRDSYPSNVMGFLNGVRSFFKEKEFFLRNFKKVNQCNKVRACMDTSHGKMCRQNRASYSAPRSPWLAACWQW